MTSLVRLLASAAALLCFIGTHAVTVTNRCTSRKLDIVMIAASDPFARLAKKLAARGTYASKFKKLFPGSGHFQRFELSRLKSSAKPSRGECSTFQKIRLYSEHV